VDAGYAPPRRGTLYVFYPLLATFSLSFFQFHAFARESLWEAESSGCEKAVSENHEQEREWEEAVADFLAEAVEDFFSGWWCGGLIEGFSGDGGFHGGVRLVFCSLAALTIARWLRFQAVMYARRKVTDHLGAPVATAAFIGV